MNDRSLTLSLLSSLLLHGLAILGAAVFMHHSSLGKAEFFTVQLVEMPPSSESSEPAEKRSRPIEKVVKPQPNTPVLKSADTKWEPRASSSVKQAEQTGDTKLLPAVKAEAPTIPTTSQVEGGGSESGVSTFFGRGEAGLMAGSNGGGGGAVTGLGRGSGAPGLPAQHSIFRANREAKPIQTARATYPAMALRAGLESDVTLKIEVDLQGTVMKAEIIKSGGAGFDEEALKAVKQSRFEPAQRDGQNVPAEFTYVYRFRLQR
jgi:TonB family protein